MDLNALKAKLDTLQQKTPAGGQKRDYSLTFWRPTISTIPTPPTSPPPPQPSPGTSGHGHTCPGSIVPFGMLQVSPDNGIAEWDLNPTKIG